MALNDYLKRLFKDCVKDKYGLDIDEAGIKIDKAPENLHGTYGANIGFLAAKPLKMNPYDAATAIAVELAGKNTAIRDPKPIKPGYVNFFIDNTYYRGQLEELLNNESYFRNKEGAGKKINIEFVSANPVGPLVVVSGRAAAYGDSLANLLSYSGYDVVKEDYVNDFGKQMDLFGVSLKERYFELFGHTAEIPEGGYLGEYVTDLAKKIRDEKGDALYLEYKEKKFELKNNFFRQYGLEKMVEWQKRTLEKFRVKFDVWFYESSLHKSGEVDEAFSIIQKRGLFKEEDGAVWLKTTEFGDDKDRVVKKQDGDYTYFASDIAYMLNKFARRGADTVINILGPDHHGYIKRMEAIVQGLGYDKSRLQVLILQQVNLLDKGERIKMSKRAGNFVMLDELVDEVGSDAARYFFVMRNYNTHLDFDIELAKEQSEKNPVFYVQYAYARVCSIFTHAQEKGVPDYNINDADFTALEPEEEELILHMIGLPDIIKEAAEKYSPSVLVAAAFDIVSKFHSFYNKHRVVSDNKGETARRIVILKGLKKTMETCFEIIGITARTRM